MRWEQVGELLKGFRYGLVLQRLVRVLDVCSDE